MSYKIIKFNELIYYYKQIDLLLFNGTDGTRTRNFRRDRAVL